METKYVYDPAGNLLAEANSSGQITRIYLYGRGLLATLSSGSLHCYHFNATGSTVAITDGSGTVVNKYAYDPFGKVMGQFYNTDNGKWMGATMGLGPSSMPIQVSSTYSYTNTASLNPFSSNPKPF